MKNIWQLVEFVDTVFFLVLIIEVVSCWEFPLLHKSSVEKTFHLSLSLSHKTFWILQILPEKSLSSPVACFLNLFLFFSSENYAYSTTLWKLQNILSWFFVSFKALFIFYFSNLTISVLLRFSSSISLHFHLYKDSLLVPIGSQCWRDCKNIDMLFSLSEKLPETDFSQACSISNLVKPLGCISNSSSVKIV